MQLDIKLEPVIRNNSLDHLRDDLTSFRSAAKLQSITDITYLASIVMYKVIHYWNLESINKKFNAGFITKDICNDSAPMIQHLSIGFCEKTIFSRSILKFAREWNKK